MVLRKALISPQYIKKGQITVTILDVVSPAHFVVKESPTLNPSSEAKSFLEAEESMQKYYESVEPCFFQLPLKDSIIVVLHNKKFYRAKVIRILTQSAGHLFRVYLVDYGIECSVPRDCIYEIERDFLDHPFQAVDLKLLGIEPVSLVMNSTDLSMSYGPVTYWDPSAEIYVHDLQKGMCNAYIEVKAIDEQYLHGSLFICYADNRMKSINDELISNTFARFDSCCWEKVHKIEDILENNITSKKFDKEEFLTQEQLNPVSNSVSPLKDKSKFPDLTTMFIRPSDGMVVAKSSFTKDNSSDSSEIQLDSLKMQVQKNCKTMSPPVSEAISPEQKVQKNCKTMSPPVSDAVSPEQKIQENCKTKSPPVSEAISPEQKNLNSARFQKLLTLNRKLYSPNTESHQDTVSKSTTPLLNNKVVNDNTSANFTVDRLESKSMKSKITENENSSNTSASVAAGGLESKSIKSKIKENENTLKDSISPTKGNNYNSSNLKNQSSVSSKVDCAESENKLKQESLSQGDGLMSKRFQKLQASCRKHHTPQTLNNRKSADLRNTSDIRNNLSKSSIDKRENSSDCFKVIKDKETLSAKNIGDTSKPSMTNDCNNSFSLSPQPVVSKDLSCVATTGSLKQESISKEDQLVAQEKFQKLQMLRRRQLLSPICQSQSHSVVNKNSSFSVETISDETKLLSDVCTDKIDNSTFKSNNSEKSQNDCTTANEFLSDEGHSIKSVKFGSEAATPNKIIDTASQVAPKQENKSQVISGNLNTFQKLQQSVRNQKMKQLVSQSEKFINDSEKTKEILKPDCSIVSPPAHSRLSSPNSDQLTCSPCIKSLPEKGSSLDQRTLPMSQHPEVVDIEKVKTVIEANGKLAQSLVAAQEPNTSVSVTEVTDLKTPDFNSTTQKEISSPEMRMNSNTSSSIEHDEFRSFGEGACATSCETKAYISINKDESPKSVLRASPPKSGEKAEKSPLCSAKGHLEYDDSDIPPMEPKQSEILNELLATSDSDDLLCSISNKKEEKFSDKGHM